LETVLPRLAEDFAVPVMIVQHMRSCLPASWRSGWTVTARCVCARHAMERR